MSHSSDVIVVGAGPVGLMLACELALAGASVAVLERDEDASSPWKEGYFGVRGMNTLAVEAFYRRGLQGDIFGNEDLQFFFRKADDKPGPFKFAGHFAGISFDGNKVDFSGKKDYYHLPGPALSPMPTWMDKIEAKLTERAESLGVSILRGKEITKLSDDGKIVKVWANDEVFEAKYLVGCDGGRSAVRHMTGIEFVGTEPDFTGYRARVDVDKPELLKPGFNNTGNGLYISLAPGYLYLIDYDTTFDRSQPVTEEHFQKILRKVTRMDLNVTKLHVASTLSDRARLAASYRKGRVFLAGDSAHIHSPMGAQGLNLGIIDAVNLGWKLAAAARDAAPAGLLDTYHKERQPVARRVLEWTRAQTLALQPGPYGEALYGIMADLIDTPGGVNFFVDRVWGLSVRYDLGVQDAHPLVGRTVPDFEFDDGERLGVKLRKARFMLVDFHADPKLAEFAQSAGSTLAYAGSNAKETFGFKALLVRPDGIVAWLADKEVDLDGLKTALAKWTVLPEA